MEQFSQPLVSITCSHDDETTLELEEGKRERNRALIVMKLRGKNLRSKLVKTISYNPQCHAIHNLHLDMWLNLIFYSNLQCRSYQCHLGYTEVFPDKSCQRYLKQRRQSRYYTRVEKKQMEIQLKAVVCPNHTTY